MKDIHQTESKSGAGWLRRLVLLGLAGLVTVLILGLILMLVPVTRHLLVSGMVQGMLHGHLESLAEDLNIQPGLQWLFSLAVVVPIGFGVTLMLSSKLRRSALGLGVVMTVLLGLGFVAWKRTRGFLFDGSGRPAVFLAFHRDGVKETYYPGMDRETGRSRVPVSVERLAWLTRLGREPVVQVDPAVFTNWFEFNSGEANLWYVESENGVRSFYNRPHFHQQLGVEAQPITREIMAEWKEDHRQRMAREDALRREREQQAAVKKAQAVELAKQQAEVHRIEALQIQAEIEVRNQMKEKERQRIALEAAKSAAELAVRQEQERKQKEAEAMLREDSAAAELAARLEEKKRLEMTQLRLREATAKPSELIRWNWVEFGTAVRISLHGVKSDLVAFHEHYEGRRFRFSGRIKSIDRKKNEVVFAPVAAGSKTLGWSSTLPEEPGKSFKVGREVTFAATVDSLVERPAEAIIRLVRLEVIPELVVPVHVAPTPPPAKVMASPVVQLEKPKKPEKPIKPKQSLGDRVRKLEEKPGVPLVTMPFRLAGGILSGFGQIFVGDDSTGPSFAGPPRFVEVPQPVILATEVADESRIALPRFVEAPRTVMINQSSRTHFESSRTVVNGHHEYREYRSHESHRVQQISTHAPDPYRRIQAP